MFTVLLSLPRPLPVPAAAQAPHPSSSCTKVGCPTLAADERGTPCVSVEPVGPKGRKARLGLWPTDRFAR